MTINVISQIGYPLAGDIDDCWAVASIWAMRVCRPEIRLPTMTEYRAAANNPDRYGATAGNLGHIMKATNKLWPTSGVVEIKTQNWGVFRKYMLEGWSASLAVLSSRLPSNLQFGFRGPHQVGVVIRDDRWLVANPLAKTGAAPIPITESALRTATEAVANKWILAAVFPPPRGDDMQTIVTLTPFAAPRRWGVAAGTTLSGYDPARPGSAIVTRTFNTPSSAQANAYASVTHVPGPGPIPRGGPFLRVVDGIFAGLLIPASLVKLEPEEPTSDCAAVVAADRAKARIVWG